MNVTLIQATPNPVETIAQIASICYDSDPKDPMKLVKHLYAGAHHSVFEHIYFTFKIEGISRACSHQLVRHRHCSFTQRSQRYCWFVFLLVCHIGMYQLPPLTFEGGQNGQNTLA